MNKKLDFFLIGISIILSVIILFIGFKIITYKDNSKVNEEISDEYDEDDKIDEENINDEKTDNKDNNKDNSIDENKNDKDAHNNTKPEDSNIEDPNNSDSGNNTSNDNNNSNNNNNNGSSNNNDNNNDNNNSGSNTDDNNSSTTNPPVTSNYFDIYFLNVYDTPKIASSLKNDSSYPNGYTTGEAFVVKTVDNKYALIDTSYNNSAVTARIHQAFKSLQKTDNVNIDYLVITHSHADHVGDALNLLGDSRFKFNKLIMKKEIKNPSPYKNISSKFNSNDIVSLSEGMKIDLGKYVEMYIFNTSDILSGKTCHKGYGIKFTSNPNAAEKINGKYYYFDGNKYPNIKVLASNSIVADSNSKTDMNNNFYAFLVDANDCNANVNSLAILFKIKTSNGNKYAYITGDLDNGGYDIVPINGIYGNGANAVFNAVSDIKLQNNFFTGYVQDRILSNSETKVANAIKNKIGSDTSNITIYQVPHHGVSSSLDSTNLLGLNKSSTYSIFPVRIDPSTNTTFSVAKNYYYSLAKTKKYYPGGSSRLGVHCIIDGTGKTTCKYY